MRKELVENWAKTKAALLVDVPESKFDMVSKVLENQRNQLLRENAAQVATTAQDIAGFRKAILPIVRRVIPGTMATELVGVQAMDAPVSLIYSMRYRYGESVTANSSSELDGTTPYHINAGDEAFGNNPPLRGFYSGGVYDTAPTSGAPLGTLLGVPAGASGIDTTDPTAAPTPQIQGTKATGEAWGGSINSSYADGIDGTSLGRAVGGSLFGGSGSLIEGSGGRTMKLDLVSQAVESGTRRLQAGWTFEAMQDLSNQHGLDIEAELAQVLAAQITNDIDYEILTDLLRLAGTVRTFNAGAVSGFTPTFIGDRFANLAAVINEVRNEIGRKTRIGVGNFIVVSPQVVSMLQTATTSVFAPAVEGSFKGPTNNHLAGTMNGDLKVYSYLWNQSTSVGNTANPYGLAAGTDKILVGFKGSTNAEAGYFYCPYIPLISTGVVMNPVTYQQSMSLFTRYGKAAFTDPTISLGNSSDFYGKINLTNLQFI